MGFFANDHKRAEKPKPKPRAGRGHIPIESMNKMGCSVCPRDKDKNLRSPKMAPDGTEAPLVYLLGTAPNEEEDTEGRHWVGNAGRAITSKFDHRFFDRSVRSGHVVQCMPSDKSAGHIEVAEIECCRGRVVSDIESTRPLVVVGVGDEPLHWATGLSRNGMAFRGTLIATKFGKHVCWYYPILYPNYIRGKQRRTKSEYELTLEHDVAWIERTIEDGLKTPVVYSAPYDLGIEQITGQEQGDMQRLEDAFHWLLGLPHLGLDIETNGIKPFMLKDPKIWTAAMGSFERTIAFPIDHPEGWGTETRQRKVRGMFGDFLLQSGRKRCHNLAFEQEWSAFFYGGSLLRKTEWEDTMAMAYAFDERKGTKSLDVQCRIHFGFFLKDQSRVDVSRANWIEEFSLKEVLRYNALDSKWTDKLADHQLPKFKHEPELAAVYEGRVRLAPTLVLTTARGLPVDINYAKDMVAGFTTKLDKIEDKARRTPEVKGYNAKFGSFSMTNPDHVLKLMKDVLHRPEVERSGYDGVIKFTSDEEALTSIPPAEVPSATLILEHRALTRCITTYLQPVIEGRYTAVDGMIHSDYSSLHTVTSRLSSEMHNWPKHKHREVRGAIYAPEGQWMVACDYGQIEFRVAGMLSGDKNIIKYSWTGYDVHKYWAERMVKEYEPIKDWVCEEFGVDWDEKGLKTLRQVAKNNWVFPQLFGSTTESCAGRMHIPLDVAADLGREFWDEFSGAKRWQEKLIESYEKRLYVETMGGFRRRGPTTRNELINMPIQGTACEIVLEGMNAVSELSAFEDNIEIQPAFNGHDDLTFLMSDAKLESNIKLVVHEMCKPRFDYINVPLIVEVSVGHRWHQLEEIGKYSSVDLFGLKNPYG